MERLKIITSHMASKQRSLVTSESSSRVINYLGNIQTYVPIGDVIHSEKNGGQLGKMTLKSANILIVITSCTSFKATWS